MDGCFFMCNDDINLGETMEKYRPTEYHAGLRWDMEKAGKVIITPGTPYPPTEYHARQKLEKHYQEKKAERKRIGWYYY